MSMTLDSDTLCRGDSSGGEAAAPAVGHPFTVQFCCYGGAGELAAPDHPYTPP